MYLLLENNKIVDYEPNNDLMTSLMGDIEQARINEESGATYTAYQGVKVLKAADDVHMLLDCYCYVSLLTNYKRYYTTLDDLYSAEKPEDPSFYRIYGCILFGVKNYVNSATVCEFIDKKPILF